MAFPFGFVWRGLISHRNRQNRARRRLPVPRLDALEDRCLPSLAPVDHGQLVYDNDAKDLKADGKPGTTGVYWLADANLAATQTFGVTGINPDGSMTWQTALNWVAAMNNVDNGPGRPKGYLGHSNWTLPLTPDVDTSGHATQTNMDTGESFGFDFYSSLFGHLFYKELGAKAGDNVVDLNDAATRLFKNFQPYYYWGGDFPGNMRANHLPVDFSFASGFLGTDKPIDFEYALPEFSVDSCDGPVAPPANATVPLMPVHADPQLFQVPGHKMVYDGALNITWLADANLAATQTFGVKGINPDGSMSYGAAEKWIAALNAADYLGHNNWRLPDAQVSDQDYYKTDNDLGELYYTELGSQAGSTIQLTHDRYEHWFHNFQPYYYWTGTEANGKTDAHETFSFGSGYRSGNTDPNDMYVIPVFDRKPCELGPCAVPGPAPCAPPRTLADLAGSWGAVSGAITNGRFVNDGALGPAGFTVAVGAAPGSGPQADSRDLAWALCADAPHAPGGTILDGTQEVLTALHASRTNSTAEDG